MLRKPLRLQPTKVDAIIKQIKSNHYTQFINLCCMVTSKRVDRTCLSQENCNDRENK